MSKKPFSNSRIKFILFLTTGIIIGIFGCKKEEAKSMLILKHVEYEIRDVTQLESLLSHLKKITLQVEGVKYKNIFFVKDKKEFVLFLECESEERYLEWRKICPPPLGAKDWYEVLLTKDEYFSE